MSSRLHQDKSIEELMPILDGFINQHKALFGIEPDTEKLISKLEALKAQKESEMFDSSFGAMTAKNIKDVIEHLGKQNINKNNGLKKYFNKNDSRR